MNKGFMVVFDGSNGAGKTTLIQQIYGALKPDTGTVLLNGRDITGLSVASRVVLAKSLAVPCAMRAMISAVAGATRIRSASRDSWMWPISASSVRSKRFS